VCRRPRAGIGDTPSSWRFRASSDGCTRRA
jgi:hypothetical protein